MPISLPLAHAWCGYGEGVKLGVLGTAEEVIHTCGMPHNATSRLKYL